MSKKIKTNFHNVPWAILAFDLMEYPPEPYVVLDGFASQDDAAEALEDYKGTLDSNQLELTRFVILQEARQVVAVE